LCASIDAEGYLAPCSDREVPPSDLSFLTISQRLKAEIPYAARHMGKNLQVRLTLFLACIGLATPTASIGAGSHFVPPNITAASDIPYPPENVASGLVSLSVNLTAGGQVQNVQVVRDIPGLTALAIDALNMWTFTPAKLDGNPVPSTINVQIVFNPTTLQNQNLPVQAGAPTPPPSPSGYFPPQISQVSYAAYPSNSAGARTIVLDLLIDKYSEVKKVTPILAMSSFADSAIAAVKRWNVNPATFNGKKVDANLVVAFVFRSPSSSTQ
jgi:Gram-negative bacterial TonB protein C-terminal